MRVVRLLIYDGEPADVQRVIAQSKSDGVHNTGNGFVSWPQMTVITLPETFAVALEAIGKDLVQRIAEKHEGKFVKEHAEELAQDIARQQQARKYQGLNPPAVTPSGSGGGGVGPSGGGSGSSGGFSVSEVLRRGGR